MTTDNQAKWRFQNGSQHSAIMETIANFLLGPFYDLKRFVAGVTSPPPPTRVVSAKELLAARAILTAAGCELSHCAENNLHTGRTTLPPEQLFDLAAEWKLWPRSAFFACSRTDEQGQAWFSYCFYKILPIVIMKLKTAVKPHHIIYDLKWGVGAGGYHAFLFEQAADGATKFSILTTFPPTRLFLEGLHDQVDYDIYRNLKEVENKGLPPVT